jgi:glycosyltransferase involved in cell wall biosynthesis
VADIGLRGALFEVLRALAQRVSRHANPFGRRTWGRAVFILVQNPETRRWLPDAVRSRTFVLPNAVLESVDLPRPRQSNQPPRALFAGWLLPLKGVSLAIRTIALLSGWQLTVCGDGPDAGRLRSLAQQLGVADRVTFLGWQPRAEVMRLMHECDVFLFPSLHDEGSWVTAEALASGLPVVSLDRGGPPVLGAYGVRATSRRGTIQALARAARAVRGHHPIPPKHLAFDAKRAAVAEIIAKFNLLGLKAT